MILHTYFVRLLLLYYEKWKVNYQNKQTSTQPSKKKKNCTPETFLGVPWLRLWAPNSGGPGSTPGQRMRSCMPQLRVHKLQLWVLLRYGFFMNFDPLFNTDKASLQCESFHGFKDTCSFQILSHSVYIDRVSLWCEIFHVIESFYDHKKLFHIAYIGFLSSVTPFIESKRTVVSVCFLTVFTLRIHGKHHVCT